jgi:hypothetical protein
VEIQKHGAWWRPVAAFDLFAILVLASGCVYEVGEGADDQEALGAVSEAVNGASAVGVIPISDDIMGIGTTCPRESTSIFSATSELVTIFMDDEDDDNQTKWTDGWVAPNNNDPWTAFYLDGGNTTFRFCRVEGSNFKPKTTLAGDTANFYAVLSLGTNCPTGSSRVRYFIDNENDQNINSSSGSIAPNTVGNPNYSSTSLYFCVYRSSATTMAAFPELGARYAVFHTWDVTKQPGWVISKHANYTDDEDDGNHNTVTGDAGVVAELRKMVGMGANSSFSMARVK